jgi:hypothetical protein
MKGDQVEVQRDGRRADHEIVGADHLPPFLKVRPYLGVNSRGGSVKRQHRKQIDDFLDKGVTPDAPRA